MTAKEEENPEQEATVPWWELEVGNKIDDDDEVTTGNKFMRYDEDEELSEETLKIREAVALIQAHEKCRQVTQMKLQRMQRREMWEKSLLETLAPQPRTELKVRAAELIQKVARTYMELKRKKLRECAINQALGISQCGKPDHSQRNKVEQDMERRVATFNRFDKQWKIQCAQIKEDYLKQNHDEIREHYRDSIRDWLRDWYDKIGLFHDIPHTNNGGSLAILRGEIPSPEEWYEKYKEYIAAKERDKNKSSQQAKNEKQAALMEKKRLKMEEQAKKKLEEKLKLKMMKNPTMHPGYYYPESKKLHKLIKALDHYHGTWDDLDAEESIEVKEKNVKRLDEENLYAEVKLEIASEVDADMKAELKKLNSALKKDYENAEEQMPEPMPEKKRRAKKTKKQTKAHYSEVIAEKMEFLAENGYLAEYPQTKLEDFTGDHNMTGDDCRCLNQEAYPFAGEIRSIWWERCREVTHGSHRILAVGPAGNGRTKLVHAMATANNAVLFVLDHAALDEDLVTPAYLQVMVDTVAACARACQPAIIYIRNAHRIYYKNKKNQEDVLPNAELLQRYFFKQLFKHIRKTDNITVVASCCDPWLTTAKLLNLFPEVVLIPDTSDSVVLQLLNNWVASNRCLPRDLDIHTLARLLQGHSFAFLNATLQHFLRPDAVVKMAAHGLFAKEIFEYVLQTGVEKPDYQLYLKWYSTRTVWGKKEVKQLEEAREFKAIEQKYAEQMELKKKKGKTGKAGHVDTATGH